MKVKVTIFYSGYSVDEYNFIAFMASKFPKDPLTMTSQGHRGFEEDVDDQYELLDTYKELLKEHIKLKKSWKTSLESLKEKGPRIGHIESHY